MPRSEEEERAIYCQWARENYRIEWMIHPGWHPIVRAECARMNAEARGEIETMPRTLTAGAELKKRKDRG